jgi:long-chain acyl-CoA synthetase
MVERFDTLLDLFETSTKEFAHKPLFGTKTGGAWRWITYDEFRKDVDRFRAALALSGVGPGDRVAIVANDSVEWAIAAYATYGRGAAFVPMYESQAPDEWDFILTDSGAKVVIGGPRSIYGRLVEAKSRIATLERVIGIALPDADEHSFRSHLIRGGASPSELVRPKPSDVAGFVYTSGTTGKPKGVLLTHGNICSNVNAVREVFPFEANERTLAFLPWAHAFGQVCELHMIISNGCSMAINDDVARLLDNLAEVRPTVLVAVPRIFNRIYDGVQAQMASQPAPIRRLFHSAVEIATRRAHGQAPNLVEKSMLALADRLIFAKVRARFGGRLKWVVSGSAALNKEVAEFIDALGIAVYEGYGLTETSPVATTNTPSARKIGSVGRALPGVRIEIDTSVTADPTIGEIVIHGPNVMRGYHNRPEENAKVFTADGGLRSGDLGYMDRDGYLYVTGRLKEQYKLQNGKYVAPAPLEEQIKLSPYIANVMLYGDNKPFNVALIVLDRAAIEKWAKESGVVLTDLTTDEFVRSLIAKELKDRSASFKGYERPQKFLLTAEDFTTENGMLTPTLKLKRRRVLDQYGSTLEALYSG